MAEHNEFGKEAEQFAVNYLKGIGYNIIKRNYYFDKKEIDIIAEKDNMLIIVEVKALKNNDFKLAEEAVTTSKKRFLVKAADHFICENNIDLETRFDVISIHYNYGKWDLEHFIDAFQSFE